MLDIFINMEKKKRQLNLQINEETSEGVYTNFVLIAHNRSEFIIDFARIMPGKPRAKVHSRVIMNPQSARLFEMSLSGALKEYEEKHSKIEVTEEQEKLMGFQILPETNAKA